ncbi:dolichyl-phosphate beta-glucosyltransferase [Steccherinum ochraceum]|uniref:dolichyl-phosphate beta-glucosyltransferase n=1 Tax=Steccherinum ochraceum TaxID=92696 RepID=A0A4R0RS82_9APHY|nr:dolichyl-phosphate beta-glucosyltransferase [Steccherinum ochraceum]
MVSGLCAQTYMDLGPVMIPSQRINSNSIGYLNKLSTHRKQFSCVKDDWLKGDCYTVLVIWSPETIVPVESEKKYRSRKSPSKPLPLGSIRDAKVAVDLTVVIPAYNETSRLPSMLTSTVNHLATVPKRSHEIIIVDDGSSDGTADMALKLAASYPDNDIRVVALVKNLGKGGAVRHGMLHGRGRRLLMVDADGASRFEDLESLWKAMDKISPDERAAVAIGSRAHLVKTEAVVKRSLLRNILMYGLHTILRIVGVGHIRDTQCGFKLFSRSAAQQIFPYQHLPSWIFDVELLLLAKQLRIPVEEAQFPLALFSHFISNNVLGLTSMARRQELPVVREQNARTAVGALPAELLAEIFKLCRGIGDNDFSHEWLYLTHVCHRWREVALQSALLWTRISYCDTERIRTKHPERALEMLIRSGTAKLDLHIDCPKAVSSVVKFLLLAIPRARTVHYDSPRQTADDVTSITPITASHLEIVELTGQVATELFSQCEMPRLRRVAMSALDLSLSTQLLKYPLTVLYLTGGGCIPHSPLKLVAVLNNMPSLTHLWINGRFLCMHAVHQTGTAHLPHMEHLISDLADYEEYACLYSRLEVPNTAHVELRLRSDMEEEMPEDAEILISAIAAHFHQLTATSGARIRGVGFNFTEYRWHAVAVHLEDPSVKGFATGRARPHLSINANEEYFFLLEILLNLLRSLPLADVASVRIRAAAFYTADEDVAIQTGLRSLAQTVMPNITVLCLIGEEPAEWIDFFLSSYEVVAPDGTQTTQWTMPRLSTLYIKDANVRSSRHRSNRRKHSKFRSDLVKTLVTRARAGHPVQRVAIARCIGAWPEDMKAMREVFQEEGMECEVLWDGIRQFKRPDDLTDDERSSDPDSDEDEEKEIRSDDGEDYVGVANFLELF